MRRALRIAVLAAVALPVTVGGATVAQARWTPDGATVVVTATAGRLPAVARPAAAVAEWRVTISWPRVAEASGYLVTRHDRWGTAETACGTVITGSSCVENRVPAGRWTYTIRAVRGAHWRGPASPASAAVTVPRLRKETARAPTKAPHPAAAGDVQAVNGAAGVAGQIDAGDALILTYPEPVAGAMPQAVTVRVDAAGVLTVAEVATLGVVELGDPGYARAGLTAAGTLTVSGARVTITIDAVGDPAVAGVVTAPGTMTWRPGPESVHTERGPSDIDF